MENRYVYNILPTDVLGVGHSFQSLPFSTKDNRYSGFMITSCDEEGRDQLTDAFKVVKNLHIVVDVSSSMGWDKDGKQSTRNEKRYERVIKMIDETKKYYDNITLYPWSDSPKSEIYVKQSRQETNWKNTFTNTIGGGTSQPALRRSFERLMANTKNSMGSSPDSRRPSILDYIIVITDGEFQSYCTPSELNETRNNFQELQILAYKKARLITSSFFALVTYDASKYLNMAKMIGSNFFAVDTMEPSSKFSLVTLPAPFVLDITCRHKVENKSVTLRTSEMLQPRPEDATDFEEHLYISTNFLKTFPVITEYKFSDNIELSINGKALQPIRGNDDKKESLFEQYHYILQSFCYFYASTGATSKLLGEIDDRILGLQDNAQQELHNNMRHYFKVQQGKTWKDLVLKEMNQRYLNLYKGIVNTYNKFMENTISQQKEILSTPLTNDQEIAVSWLDAYVKTANILPLVSTLHKFFRQQGGNIRQSTAQQIQQAQKSTPASASSSSSSSSMTSSGSSRRMHKAMYRPRRHPR